MTKITCTQENLARALSYLEYASGKQASLPILSNCLIQSENGRLKFSATNLEIGVECYVGAKIDGDVEITAPIKLLNTFIQNLPSDGIVEIAITGLSMQVSSGTHLMRIHGLDIKDFPIIPKRQAEYFCSFNALALKEALQRVFSSVSTHESRIELTGVCFFLSDMSVTLVSTDSFRLSEVVVPLEASKEYGEYISSVHSIILPLQTLQEVARVIAADSEKVRVLFEENQVFFDVDGVSILSRIIDGKFPDYKQILPKSYEYQVRLGTDEFLRSVRMANIFSSMQNGEVLLTLSPEKQGVVVSSKSSEIGENSTVLKGDIAGSKEISISFNPRFLQDGLGNIRTQELVFLANTESSPVAIREVGEDAKVNEDFLYLMMPIRK